MSHVKISPIASACQNPMSIFSRGFGLAFLGWLTKWSKLSPDERESEMQMAMPVLFSKKQLQVLVPNPRFCWESMHCESQTLVLLLGICQILGFGNWAMWVSNPSFWWEINALWVPRPRFCWERNALWVPSPNFYWEIVHCAKPQFCVVK